MTAPVQIQLEPIDVPEDKPFAHDLLDRKDFVQAMVTTLAATEGSAVFAVDGRWGSGKTTFARMLSCLLKQGGFKVVEINAWDTDYTNDPLAALTHALIESMDHADQRRKRIKEAGVALFREAAFGAVQLATAGVLGGKALADIAKQRFDSFQERATAMRSFQDQLREVGASGDKPLVVIVDELDRCKPTYAVGMLEVIKHVFDVESVLFVLTVNRTQLDRSAAVLYGSTSDPESYFGRFFDIEVSLPDGDKALAVRRMMQSIQISEDGMASTMLMQFLTKSPHGIRAVGQMLRHYSVVANSLSNLPQDQWQWALSTAMLLRLFTQEKYREWIRGEVTDKNLADSLFDLN